MGFATVKGSQKHGFLSEEAYPELERGYYVTDELGLPDGFIENKLTGPEAILNKYGFPEGQADGSGRAKVAAGAMGAAALELLVDDDPELLDAIRDHRQSPEELDAVVGGHLDRTIPGLYDEMQGVDLDSPSAQQQAISIFVRVYQHFQN